MISANDGTAIPTATDHAERLTETIRLAYEIADDCARSDIECYAEIKIVENVGWYSTQPREDQDEGEARWVARALRYLRLRDLLEFDPEQPHLVKVRAG